jgi:hypothetical protein
MSLVDITGLDPAEVVIALYERARAQGMGALYATHEPLTVEAARQVLEHTKPDRIDYLLGRVMKVNLHETPGAFDARLYDRDNGTGAAAAAVAALRERKKQP